MSYRTQADTDTFELIVRFLIVEAIRQQKAQGASNSLFESCYRLGKIG